MIRGSGDGCLLSASAGGLGFPIHPPQAAVVPPGDGKGSRNPSPEHPFGVAGWGPGLWHKAGWSCSQHRASRYRPEEMGGPGCGFCNGKIIPVNPHPRIPGAPPGRPLPRFAVLGHDLGIFAMPRGQTAPWETHPKICTGLGEFERSKTQDGAGDGATLTGFCPWESPIDSHPLRSASTQVGTVGHISGMPRLWIPKHGVRGKGLASLLPAPTEGKPKTHGQGASIPGPLGRGEPGPQR